MQRSLIGLASDEGGAAAIEYALVASLISVSLLAALTVLGVNLAEKAEGIGEALAEAGR